MVPHDLVEAGLTVLAGGYGHVPPSALFSLARVRKYFTPHVHVAATCTSGREKMFRLKK